MTAAALALALTLAAVLAAADSDAGPNITPNFSPWQWGFSVASVLVGGAFGFIKLRNRIDAAAEDASKRAAEALERLADAETKNRAAAEAERDSANARADSLAAELVRLHEKTDLTPLMEALLQKWQQHTEEHKAIMRSSERIADALSDEVAARHNDTMALRDVLERLNGGIDLVLKFVPRRASPPDGSAHPMERSGEPQHYEPDRGA